MVRVLIALTIIGVIAAITVPTLMQNIQKQEYVSALKKAYSTLSQATNMIIAENGSPKTIDGENGWGSTNEDVYKLYKKYLRNAKECGTGTGCFAEGRYKTLNNYDWFNFDEITTNDKLVLSDGMAVMFWGFNPACTSMAEGDEGGKSCMEILVDVNGSKGPNKAGIDYFEFVLREYGLFPEGCSAPKSNIDENCSRRGSGQFCACKVLTEGAMNY